MSQFMPPTQEPQDPNHRLWHPPAQPEYTQPQTYYPPQQQVPMPGMRPYWSPDPPPEPLVHPQDFKTIVGVIVAIIIVVSIALASRGTFSSGTSSVNQTATVGQSTPVDQYTPPLGTWTTTHSFSGSGSQKTAIFAVPNDWKIIWKCTGFTDGSGIDGNMNIAIYDDQNQAVDNLYEVCKVGGSSGVSEEHQGGNVYLSIDHAGAGWSVKIQELK